MRHRDGLIALVLAASPSAFAQDANTGFDAHGFYMVPQDGDPRDPLLVERAGRFTQGEFWATGLFEYADAPLQVQTVGQNGANDPVAALDDLAVFNLSAGVAVHDRVRLALSAPLIVSATHLDATQPNNTTAPTSGGGIGDLRLSAMFGLKQTDVGGGGFGLALAPFLDLPTGQANAFLGKPGVAGGVKLSTSIEASRLTVSADVGAQFDPSQPLGNVSGGAAVIGGVAAGVLLTDNVGLNAEVYARPYIAGANPVQGLDTKGTVSPAEAAVSVRGRMDNGFHFAVGGAKGISPGIGAANYRVFVQLGFGRIYAVKGDFDADGIGDDVDACPKEAEVYNEYQDTDGCPDAGGALLVETWINGRVEEYIPVVARRDGEVVGEIETALPDPVRLEVPAGSIEVAATAPGFRGSKTLDVVQGKYPVRLDLTPVTPAKVRVIAVDNAGNPVQRAGLSIVGDGAPNIGWLLDEDGTIEVEVPPGQFIVFVKSKGLGIFRADVVLESGVEREIRATLGAARAVVLQDRIQLNENVYFDTSSANLRSESFALLDEVSDLLVATPEITRMEIQGHTSTEGADEANLVLSQQRAEAVLAYLVKHGVAAGRLTAVGYGETQPIADESTAEGRALNRRVEFIITERVQK